MTPRNAAQIAIMIGVLLLLWLAAVGTAPFVSASPASQATAPAALATPAATATSPPAAETPEAQTYVVEAGDTLWSIATKFYGNGSKYTAILRANNMADNERLQIGQTLIIPALTATAPTALPKTGSAPSPAPSSAASRPPQTPAGGIAATPSAPSTSTPVSAEPVPPVAEPPQTSVPDALLTYVGLLIDVLSAICLIGSVTCGFLSMDAYRRSKRFVQRDYIRKRIRVKV